MRLGIAIELAGKFRTESDGSGTGAISLSFSSSASGTEWDPSRPATTLNFWVSGDSNVTQSSGVTVWGDRSGHSNDLDTVSSSHPDFSASDANGRPSVGFTGASSQVLSKSSVNLVGTGAYTFFVVVKLGTTNQNSHVIGNTSGTGGVSLGLLSTPTRIVTQVGVVNGVDGTSQATAYEIWVVRRVAASAPTLRVNAVGQSLTGATAVQVNPGASGTLQLGAVNFGTFSSFFTGRIAEAGEYGANLSDTDRGFLETYLATKFGISI